MRGIACVFGAERTIGVAGAFPGIAASGEAAGKFRHQPKPSTIPLKARRQPGGLPRRRRC